jgi:hypothetical protein
MSTLPAAAVAEAGVCSCASAADDEPETRNRERASGGARAPAGRVAAQDAVRLDVAGGRRRTEGQPGEPASCRALNLLFCRVEDRKSPDIRHCLSLRSSPLSAGRYLQMEAYGAREELTIGVRTIVVPSSCGFWRRGLHYRGRETVTVVPWSGAGWTVREPPCARARSRIPASPSDLGSARRSWAAPLPLS